MNASSLHIIDIRIVYPIFVLIIIYIIYILLIEKSCEKKKYSNYFVLSEDSIFLQKNKQ